MDTRLNALSEFQGDRLSVSRIFQNPNCPIYRVQFNIQPGSSVSEILLPVSTFLLYFNFFQFLFTAIPMRYRVICKGFESDGLQIVHALKNTGSQESNMDHKSNPDD